MATWPEPAAEVGCRMVNCCRFNIGAEGFPEFDCVLTETACEGKMAIPEDWRGEFDPR